MYESKVYRSVRNISRLLGINKLINTFLDDGYYERKFENALESAIKKDAIVWDVGSNHGLYIDKFLKVLENQGKILAFEPNKKLHHKLSEKYQDRSNVEIFGTAVSNFKGETNFSEGEDDLAATSQIGDPSDNSYKVLVEDIKELIERLGAPDVVKIDIEGAEAQIIDRVGRNITSFENIKFFIEVHFSIIESDHDSDLFFSNLAHIKSNSKEFQWIDPSHLFFRL